MKSYRIFNFGKTWKARHFDNLKDAIGDLKDSKNERVEKLEVKRITNTVKSVGYNVMIFDFNNLWLRILPPLSIAYVVSMFTLLRTYEKEKKDSE